jgi:subtilisin family serine protease
MKTGSAARFLMAASLLVMVSCSSRDSGQPLRRLIAAPQSESQTGYLIDLSSDSEQPEKIEAAVAELEKRGARIRSINPRHGLFEVYDLTPEQIGETVPQSNIQKNIFTKKRQVLTPQLIIQNYCHRIPTAPHMIIQAQAGGKTLVLEDPQLISRNSAQGFSAKVQFAGAVPEHHWEVFPPVASAHKGLKVKASEIQFKPDELGEYEVYLVVKLNATHGCIRGLAFGVTDNVPYGGPTFSQPLPVETRLTQFAHLNALGMREAWKYGNGYNVKIAILDTGVDFNHPDIAPNIAINKLEATNGRDDDNNKFVDDNIGWDFVNNDNNPYDDDLHGTHVAGLSGSLVGVAPAATILPVKVLGPFGGDMGSLAGAIYYAVDSKARIINMSLGGESTVPTFEKALAYASQRGVLVVVAAGNESVDIDLKPSYPASYILPSLLAVAATDLTGNLTEYSNVGAQHVGIAAPGGSEADGGLLSAMYKNRLNKKYVPLQGTSMASPVVSGVAAVMMSAKPALSAVQVKSLIMANGTLRADYSGKIASQRFVNVTATLQAMGAPRIIQPIY